MSSRARKAANLSLPEPLLNEAKALGINLSRAAELGISAAIAEERARLWKLENAEALASSNTYVAENGLPLSAFRQF
ncbi:type II toxin-antitoxin system CcdA family antitoxin [Roseibium litorale]|uniref:Type II toxin-antitoxin system CcdA family antitoxin n=1 Tax=Roseibium litorale TaxID=2803841 RepID=A0ABR9CTQ7_9HYPH|nr:type II toxin-antitoxin system CcdA family antitoxin [Roseibium litorale]MBD8894255.1 type II toxin-antitoxin system CcdA family antitoxin [Roseibium litorale]